MPACFLIRDCLGVSMMEVFLAAFGRKDRPELLEWLSDKTKFCLVNGDEFEQTRSYPGAIVLCSPRNESEEIAVVFGPRNRYAKQFRGFRSFWDELHKARIERENITESRWLETDDRPGDLANFAL